MPNIKTAEAAASKDTDMFKLRQEKEEVFVYYSKVLDAKLTFLYNSFLPTAFPRNTGWRAKPPDKKNLSPTALL